MVNKIKTFKTTDKIFFSVAAEITNIPYSSFMHYKARVENNEDPVNKRGRKKIEGYDPQELEFEIRKLTHVNKRTHGAGKVIDEYKGRVSREVINQMIQEIREEMKRGRYENMERIFWNSTQSAWSMDDFEIIFKGIKFYVHQVQDMSSKYKFEPLISDQPINGEEVAGNLDKLCRIYNAPLFLKRDNGGNLNHFSVISVMSKYLIIPLNNPAFYPQYNGSMEHAQGEVKRKIEHLAQNIQTADAFEMAVVNAVNSVNHHPRPSLDGQHSCFFFSMHKDVKFSKQYRKEVFDYVKEIALEITANAGYDQESDKDIVFSSAWRKAVKLFLQQNNMITVSKNGKVLPISA